MKPLFRTLVVSFLLAASAALAAPKFEGNISLTLTTGKQKPQALTYAIKDQAIRLEMTTNGLAFVYVMDLSKAQMLLLVPSLRMYMAMPITPPAETAQPSVVITKTGRAVTILGYKCDEYVAKDKGVTTEVWLAEGLGTFMGLGSGNPILGGASKIANSWEDQLKGKESFPLRVVTRDANGAETSRMETTKIEARPLADALFAPPADYRKL